MSKHLSNITLKNLNFGKIPEENGVYFFKDKAFNVLYIGKSKNLKNRIRSYFSTNLHTKTKRLIDNSYYLSYIKVQSEIEALILESILVKKYKPLFNIELKDDKNPLYIRITDGLYPLVLTARKKDVSLRDNYYGPFPSSSNVKTVLKIIRKLIPFSQHRVGRRPCIHHQMGLCDPCPSNMAKLNIDELKKREIKRYKNNIKNIKLILNGKLNSLKKSFTGKIRKYSLSEDFETAKIYRDKVKIINYITKPVTPAESFIENPNLLEDIRNEELNKLSQFLRYHLKIEVDCYRIECYDISHLSGSFATASMVTFVAGESEKNLYRHFKIMQKKGNDDLKSLSEVAKRRLKYLSLWGKPSLIIVDGGKTQTLTFFNAFKNQNITIIGLAKNFERLIIPIKKGQNIYFKVVNAPYGPVLNLIQRIRDEAHRFARVYHHKLFERQFLIKNR